ncbi:MAG: alkyl hydroperoxide reductase [Gemmatimonadaceae bacterium]
MRELESRYPDDLVVIGVHCGKYHAERVTERIRDASLRLRADHPVLNDRQFRTWRSYAVSAWPTVAVIDPAGRAMGVQAGEFTADFLAPYIERVSAELRASGASSSNQLSFPPDAPTVAPGLLRYPGKVEVDGNRLVIADSGNHRIIIARISDTDPSQATIDRIVGDGNPGLVNGRDGQFDSPQGIALAGDVLYVADAGNHCVRELDLVTGELGTLAGNGNQIRSAADRSAGSLSSPWDVTLAGDNLYVAMAGTHQLWSIDTRTRQSRIHCGTGGENIVDGQNRQAVLAQPMGITSFGQKLFFADSESSAIRYADIAADGVVGTIVGTGLFDFGSVDGVGDEVRLQHPQAVTPHPAGGILVADSYNDCIKLLDPSTRSSRLWLDGLHEPSGISCSLTHAYITDTNAHRVLVVDLTTRAVTALELS